MSNRIAYLTAHPRRSIVALATVLASVGLAVGSGASWTAQTANPSNTFSSGTLTMSNSKANAAVLTASNLKPGDSAQGNVDIQNTGSIAGTFALSRSALNDSDGVNPLSSKLNLVVKDCGTFASGTPSCNGGSPVKYTGTLAAMSSSSALGTFAADEKHRYEFTITFDSGASNAFQGGTSTATFQWDAAQ